MNRKWVLVAVIVLALVAVTAAIAIASGGDDDGEGRPLQGPDGSTGRPMRRSHTPAGAR